MINTGNRQQATGNRSKAFTKQFPVPGSLALIIACCLLLLALSGCGSSSSTPAPGAISVSAQSDFGVTVSDAKVFLNDVEKGTAPLEITNLSPGTYTLKLTSALYKDYTASVVVQSSVTTTVTAAMEAREPVPDASTVFTKQ